MILGMDWLEMHNPMQCDWAKKTIGFMYKGQHISLQGVQCQPVEELAEISGEQLLKLQKGNDMWALVVLSSVSDNYDHLEKYVANGIPPQVIEVIHELESLFQPTDALPPSRAFDHTISLLPDAVPINFRSYKYTPQQKDEIESSI
jgi:hypothetical protein